jgi:hypothetical protein
MARHPFEYLRERKRENVFPSLSITNMVQADHLWPSIPGLLNINSRACRERRRGLLCLATSLLRDVGQLGDGFASLFAHLGRFAG